MMYSILAKKQQEDIAVDIYEKLRLLRENAGLKQTDMAKLLNTTQQYYSQYELGNRKLPADHIRTICLHFRISADYLLDIPKGMHYPNRKG